MTYEWKTFDLSAHIKKLSSESELQIRGSIDDNSEDNFSYFSTKTSYDPSLEPSQQDGSNGGSQNMFLWRSMANYHLIIPITSSYLEH